jgi:hypothetical protein
VNDRWGTRHDFQTEQAETAERLKHERELCNPVTCIYCIDERDLDDLISYTNDQLDKERQRD